jgi:adenosylcobyric acid synthase
VTQTAGIFADAADLEIEAYEIHVGRTEVTETRWPFAVLQRQGRRVEEPDGALNRAGNVVGTYLHGLFVNGGLRRALLAELAARKGQAPDPRWGAPTATRERYDRLADIVAASSDLATIGKLVALELGRGGDEMPRGEGR